MAKGVRKSAPAASNALTTARCPSAAAHIIAVWPSGSFASLPAPRANSTFTTATLPVRAAVMSGVSPP